MVASYITNISVCEVRVNYINVSVSNCVCANLLIINVADGIRVFIRSTVVLVVTYQYYVATVLFSINSIVTIVLLVSICVLVIRYSYMMQISYLAIATDTYTSYISLCYTSTEIPSSHLIVMSSN